MAATQASSAGHLRTSRSMPPTDPRPMNRSTIGRTTTAAIAARMNRIPASVKTRVSAFSLKKPRFSVSS